MLTQLSKTKLSKLYLLELLVVNKHQTSLVLLNKKIQIGIYAARPQSSGFFAGVASFLASVFV